MAIYFVHSSGTITSDGVLRKVRFLIITNHKKNSFRDVLKDFQQESLEKFPLLLTGTKSLWPLRIHKDNINVEFVNATSFCAST